MVLNRRWNQCGICLVLIYSLTHKSNAYCSAACIKMHRLTQDQFSKIKTCNAL